MARSGPIIIVEDDEDDVLFLKDTINQLEIPNKLLWFPTCKQAFHYLKTTSEKPFIIICDVNLPLQNGIEFKRSIDTDYDLRRKSIPFIFYSTSVAQGYVDQAYSQMTVQGFFQKGSDFKEIQYTIQTIMNYWLLGEHPSLE